MGVIFSTTFLVIMMFMVFSCSDRPTSFSLPSINESFGQAVTYNRKVDILFVIDNSKSMLQHQQRLSARIPDMIAALNSLGMDYHIAVTTTTMTKNSDYAMTRQILGEPKYLTRSNIHLLSDRLLVGDSGSDNERGLDSLAFVTGSYASTNAAGFLRTDALFVVNILADENDNSVEMGQGSSNDFVNYMNAFRPKFKDGGRAWIANYIGTIQNQNCDFLGGHVSIGTNYLKLVDASKGVKESICVGDLTAAVSNIKARIIDQITAYRLADAPNKSTIKVSVGGVNISEGAVNGWTLEYETDANGIKTYYVKFHGTAVPADGMSIRVDYTPANAS
ncbi:MAG: hypothetical protein H7328_07245 [Bdellovibrio sp.]|nr:hypothetical protein [Bdellovibrio sp.]